MPGSFNDFWSRDRQSIFRNDAFGHNFRILLRQHSGYGPDVERTGKPLSLGQAGERFHSTAARPDTVLCPVRRVSSFSREGATADPSMRAQVKLP